MAKAHTPAPLQDPPPLTEEDEGDSSSASSMSSTGTIVPPTQQKSHIPALLLWHDCFEQELYLNGYHVYITPPRDLAKDPLFVCHHGAGSSGLSFALFASALRKRLPSAGVMAIEARDHGSVIVGDEDSKSQTADMSLAILTQDLMEMIVRTETKLAWKERPNIVLVGHSLGGAVVTDVAKKDVLGTKLVGYAVIDVVEGSAMEALKSMQRYLNSRPSCFTSIEAAIEWHIRSRTIRNPLSARMSTPPLLRESQPGKWVWRTDLSVTQTYWQNWFSSMSAKFLSGKAAKLLILAGTDRLDKELMIGQMQGKFQLSIFAEAGHFVQEDMPEKTAEVVTEFYKRNDRSTMVLPPKVSDLLKQGKKV